MPASELSAENIAARLSAAGLTPRVEQYARHTSIEVEVPDDFPAGSWRRPWKWWRMPIDSAFSPAT